MCWALLQSLDLCTFYHVLHRQFQSLDMFTQRGCSLCMQWVVFLQVEGITSAHIRDFSMYLEQKQLYSILTSFAFTQPSMRAETEPLNCFHTLDCEARIISWQRSHTHSLDIIMYTLWGTPFESSEFCAFNGLHLPGLRWHLRQLISPRAMTHVVSCTKACTSCVAIPHRVYHLEYCVTDLDQPIHKAFMCTIESRTILRWLCVLVAHDDLGIVWNDTIKAGRSSSLLKKHTTAFHNTLYWPCGQSTHLTGCQLGCALLCRH